MNERITARVVLINDENKILLLKMHNNGKSFWLTPGGKIENSETPLQAAQRELFEETGIANACITPQHKWYLEHIGMCDSEQTLFKEYIFLARISSATVTSDNQEDYEKDEISSFTWWDVREFKESNEKLRPADFIDELISFMYPNQKFIHYNQKTFDTTSSGEFQ